MLKIVSDLKDETDKMPNRILITLRSSLHLQKERHARQNPLGWLLLCLEAEGPHIMRSSLPSFIHGALIQVAALSLVHGDGLRRGGELFSLKFSFSFSFLMLYICRKK